MTLPHTYDIKKAFAAERAPRLRRPSWRDPRLLTGIALVAVATAAGAQLLGAATDTVTMWVATEPLAPGDQLQAGRLGQIEVSPGPLTDRYLRVDAEGPPELWVTRAVSAGELLPLTALGPTGAQDLRTVAIPTSEVLSERIVKGALVDIWVVPGGQRETAPAAPSPVVEAVLVEQVERGGNGLMIGGRSTVHAQVPLASLPALLGALARNDTISVLPVPGLG